MSSPSEIRTAIKQAQKSSCKIAYYLTHWLVLGKVVKDQIPHLETEKRQLETSLSLLLRALGRNKR